MADIQLKEGDKYLIKDKRNRISFMFILKVNDKINYYLGEYVDIENIDERAINSSPVDEIISFIEKFGIGKIIK